MTDLYIFRIFDDPLIQINCIFDEKQNARALKDNLTRA